MTLLVKHGNLIYNIDMPLITLTCKICLKEYQMSSWYKGRLYCSNKCRGVALKQKGITPPSRQGSIPWNKGLTATQDHRLKKISEDRKGSKNSMWKHGNSKSHRISWQSSEHKAWRKAVFERDGYTCQICLIKGGELQADHIKCFAHHEALRFEVSNGRTLCIDCHKKTPNFGMHKRDLCV